jgi:hypothetical protein
MTPVATRFGLAAKAAARGTMNRKKVMKVNKETQRFLTLPPGSVRGYPFHGSTAFANHLSNETDTDMSKSVARDRAELHMSPKRRYGTSTSMEIPEYMGNVSIHSSFREDYDDSNFHCTAANATSCDLGQLYDGESAADSTIFATTLMGNSIRVGDHSTFFEHDDDYYAKLERNLGILDVDGEW